MEKKTEILAPAGSMETLTAAIRTGADAVYLGAKEFSARRNAENFSLDEIENAVKYCHIRGVSVYLTLNILIKDVELKAAFDLAKAAYNFGIDGIILQDLGLAWVLHEKIPQLKLHASTQMSVHSVSALPMLKKLGFCRVVAAREMSRTDLKKLCSKAGELGMSVEVFVHGALCMSVSGQCLLSAFLGSRSGNRGLCAGPCRLPFKAPGGTGYDLSLKDLSLLGYMGELRDMGVESFKIEGRMKRPEYVAAATAACRQALDNGFVGEKLEKTLKDVFSRSGFTAGYYENKTGRQMFGIRTKEDVVSSSESFALLHELYRSERNSVPVKIKVEVLKNNPVSLTIKDFDGNAVTALGKVPEKAERSAVTKEGIVSSIRKLGSTPYFSRGEQVSIDGGLFVSAGEFNSLRRNAVEMLNVQRSKLKHEKSGAKYAISESIEYAKNENRNQKIICRFENTRQIPEDLSGVWGVMFPLEKDPPERLSGHEMKIVDIPRGISDEGLIEKRLKIFAEKGFMAAACGNLAAMDIAKRYNFSVLADNGMNIYNSESIKAAKMLGADAVTLSLETELNKTGRPGGVPVGITAYGKIPLMIFKNCPLKNGTSCRECGGWGFLTDRKGIKFPVRCRMGYSEMLNCVPVWLADKRELLRGLDFITLYFTDETSERAGYVIDAYLNGRSADIKYTGGLYQRGSL